MCHVNTVLLTEESDVTGRTPWLTNHFTQDRQDYTTMEAGNRQNMLFRDIYRIPKDSNLLYQKQTDRKPGTRIFTRTSIN